MTPTEFYELALAYCRALGASMTSAYRTVAHNAAVGGVPGSAHRVGLAVDVVYDVPQDETLRIETALNLGLRLLVEGDHDHLQPIGWGVKKQ